MRPPRHEVVDLTHRIGSEAERLIPRLRAFYVDLAMAGTAAAAGETITTPLPCRFRPSRRTCLGTLIVHRSHVPPVIRWQCSACAAGGILNEFQGTEWDQSGSRHQEANGTLVLDYPGILHGSLCDAVREDAALRLLVHRGQLARDRVEVRLDRQSLRAIQALLLEGLAGRTLPYGRRVRFLLGVVAALLRTEATTQVGDPELT